MELPDSVYDAVIDRVQASSILFLLAIYRHGRQVVDGAGDRRAYLSLSTQRLARRAGISRRAAQHAVQELRQLGVLRRHEPSRHNAPPGWSAPYSAPDPPAEFAGGANFATPAGTPLAPHGGGGDSRALPHRENDPEIPTTTTPREEGGAESAPLIAELAELGISEPARTVARFGEDVCRAALRRFDIETARWQPRNPAGYFMTRAAELSSKPQVVQRELEQIETAPLQDRGYIGSSWRNDWRTPLPPGRMHAETGP